MTRLPLGREYQIVDGPDRAELFANQIGDNQHRRAIEFCIRLKTSQQPERPHRRMFQLNSIARIDGDGHSWLIKGFDISSTPWVKVWGHYITVDNLYWVGVEARAGKKIERGWLRRMYRRTCESCSRVGDFREEEVFCVRCGKPLVLTED
jgi:hypothetical protein